jgi:chromosome condensin MukBEF MukE localization factor
MAQGLAASLGELAEAVRDFGADVREAMAEREGQLRAAAGLSGIGGVAGAEGADDAAPR